MKNLIIMGLLIGIFVITSCNEDTTTKTTSSLNIPDRDNATESGRGSTCDATSTIQIGLNALGLSTGVSCNANCSEGQIATCIAYFWSASCSCSSIGMPVPDPTYTMPVATNQELEFANDFKTFCLEHSSEDMNVLGDITANDIIAVIQQNQEDFEYYENLYNLQFFSLSSQDQNDIYTWIDNYGDDMIK